MQRIKDLWAQRRLRTVASCAALALLATGCASTGGFGTLGSPGAAAPPQAQAAPEATSPEALEAAQATAGEASAEAGEAAEAGEDLATQTVPIPQPSPAPVVEAATPRPTPPSLQGTTLDTESYLKSLPYTSLVQAKFNQLQGDLYFPCNDRRLTSAQTMVVDNLGFPAGAPHPDEGMWFQYVGFERCGVPQAQLMQFQSKGGEEPAAAGLLAGFTRADPQLQLEMLVRSVMPFGAERFAETCPLTEENAIRTNDGRLVLAPNVIDTYSANYQRNEDGSRSSWTEYWVVELCEHITLVRLRINNLAGRMPPTQFSIGQPTDPAEVPAQLLEAYKVLREGWEDGATETPIVRFTKFGTPPAS